MISAGNLFSTSTSEWLVKSSKEFLRFIKWKGNQIHFPVRHGTSGLGRLFQWLHYWWWVAAVAEALKRLKTNLSWPVHKRSKRKKSLTVLLSRPAMQSGPVPRQKWRPPLLPWIRRKTSVVLIPTYGTAALPGLNAIAATLNLALHPKLWPGTHNIHHHVFGQTFWLSKIARILKQLISSPLRLPP